MGLSGAAGGAARALEEILAERFEAQKLRALIAEREQQAAIQRESLAQRGLEANDEKEYRRQQTELADRTRRDRSNKEGMDLMREDRATMDTDAAIAGLPAHLKPLGGPMKAGLVGKLSPEDLEDPAAKAKRITDAREQAIQDQIRVRKATREPRATNYERVVVDGKENFLTPEEVRARGGVEAASRKRASTGMERQALGFYNRMKDALDTMDALEEQLPERDLALINNSPLPDLINNRLLTPAGQQYAQALQTYTEGRLRKESGAAIAEHEFASDRKTIGRQANDQPEVRAQKKTSRRKTHEGIGFAAGPAYEEFYGEPFQRIQDAPADGPMQKRVKINGVDVIAESTDGGKTWKRVQ